MSATARRMQQAIARAGAPTRLYKANADVHVLQVCIRPAAVREETATVLGYGAKVRYTGYFAGTGHVPAVGDTVQQSGQSFRVEHVQPQWLAGAVVYYRAVLSHAGEGES